MGHTVAFDGGEVDVRLVVQNPRSCSVTRMSAGSHHTCALLLDGRVYCWGANESGQLGVGDKELRTTPAFVPTTAPAVEVLAGGNGTCARLTTGEVTCWGNVPGAAAGTQGLPKPTLVPLPGNATGVVTGGDHACALVATGAVFCWGRGGLVGDGTLTDQSLPVVVPGLPANVDLLFASPRHTCAQTTTGGVWCWGNNDTGALGLPPLTGGLSPTLTEALTAPVVRLALAAGQTCALLAEEPKDEPAGKPFKPGGRLACVPPLEAPLRPEWGDGWRSLAAGDAHLCAVHSDGVLRCTGNNDQGQAGPDPRLRIPDGEPVAVLPDAISVRAGSGHTCALLADRKLRCWGRNTEGQLGIGSLVNTNTPSPVAFPPGCPLM